MSAPSRAPGALTIPATRWRGTTALAANVAFCLLVAAGVSVLLGDYSDALVISLAIGLSIQGAAELVFRLGRGRLSIASVHLLAAPAGMLAGLALAGWLLRGHPAHYYADASATWVLAVVFGIAGSLIFLNRHAARNLREQLAIERAQRIQGEKALVEAQLRVLQAQIEPHFLFNTLSNVSSLIETSPQTAQAMLGHLTRLLRSSLTRARAEHVTLADEMDVTRAYLEIQCVRLGARLRYRIDCCDALLTAPMPPMLIQPLVENAVRHGIEPLAGGGEVVVSVRRRGAAFAVSVEDDGRGLEQGADEARGVTLSSLRERLAALYGSEGAFVIRPLEPRGTRVELLVPLS